jgi:hypothetical protein
VLGSPTEQTPVFAAAGALLGSDLGIVKHAWSEQRCPATAAAAMIALVLGRPHDASPDSITPGGQRLVRSSSNACLAVRSAALHGIQNVAN